MNILKKIKKHFVKVVEVKVPIYIPVYYGELLKNRYALITGGNSGIGFAIAEAFLRNGANVVISGRNQEKLSNACEKLSQTSTESNIDFVLLDNENMQSVQNGFQKVLEKTGGKLDILVNNAGVSSGDFSNLNEKEFDTTLNINLKSVYFLSSLFATHIKSSENINRANILNIASSSSLRPATSPYMLSKWGIRGLTLGLAKSFIPYNIVVNALAPGPTATPMLVPHTQESIDLPTNPIKRFATPQEIANMAVVLVSDMSRTIVGDCVYMSGGAGLITFDDVDYGF